MVNLRVWSAAVFRRDANRGMYSTRAAPMTLSRRRFLQMTAAAGGAWCVTRGFAQSPGSVAGKGSLLHDAAAWQRFRREMERRADSRTALATEADAWRASRPITIVGKKMLGPTGDPHDYVSIGPYLWPDPAKPDGLPWITRDGEVNPVFYDTDNPQLERLCRAVPRLAFQAEATDSRAHAERAGQFLRAWFLEPETRMNPHLRFAQKVPGRADGTPTGIIDGTSLIFLADAASRLPLNAEWTAVHLAGLKVWFAQYVDWLLTSDNGRLEGATKNNHGSWYDAQVACLAVFADRPDVARRQVEAATRARIAHQVEPDGRQPEELRRTLSLTYSTYNLLAHACTARIASGFGIDLWNWKSADGRSLRGALQWLLPFYARERPWPHPQIHSFDFSSAAILLNLASQGAGDVALARVCDAVEEHPWQRLSFSKASMTGREVPRPD